MTDEEFTAFKKEFTLVDDLLGLSVESRRDATEAMKFAQAAVNAADAINRKWMGIASNKPYKSETTAQPEVGL